MTESPAASPLEALSLKTVTAGQVIVSGAVLYSFFRFVGDPPYPHANLWVYFASIIGPALVLAGLLLLARLITRATRHQPVGAAVIITVSLAAVIGQAVVPASGSVVAETRLSTPLIAIVTESALLALLWIGAALAYLSISAYVAQARQLRAREEALEGELIVLDRRAMDEEQRIARNIGEIAQGTLAELTTSNLNEVAAVLRAWSEDVVRPLSRDLAANSEALRPVEGKDMPSPWVTAARTVTKRDPIPVLLITGVALAASPGLLFRTYPPTTAAWALLGVTALTAAGAYLVNVVTRPLLPRMSVPWRLCIIYVACLPLAFAELVPFTLPALFGQVQEQTEQSLSALWLGPVISPVFVLFIVWLRIALAAGDETLTIAQSRARELAIQVAMRNLFLRQRRKAWAHALHGQVQSAMLAASIRLDREQHSGLLDQATVELACEPVWEALATAQSASVAPPDWQQGVARLHTLWDGLIDLRINADSEALDIINRSGLCRSGAIDVLTESISNAVRHGRATQVWVSMAPGQGSTVLVAVVDDGQPIDAERPQGLGSALLAEVSVDWARERIGDRNYLSVELPALALPAAQEESLPSDRRPT